MDHVIISFHPFVMAQNISVYKNGECVEVKECHLKDVSETCYELCKKHDIHQVDYCGNRTFGKKIEDKFKDFNLTEYDNFNVTFTYH